MTDTHERGPHGGGGRTISWIDDDGVRQSADFPGWVFQSDPIAAHAASVVAMDGETEDDERLVEVMARAMCPDNWNARSFCETANGEEPEEQRAYWCGLARAALAAYRFAQDARAAIAAMREESRAMRDAAKANTDLDSNAVAIVWQAMIDAAIAE